MSSVQTVDRAFDILELLATVDKMSLNNIRLKVGLNKTTTFRILKSLRDNGYVRQNAKGEYLLTYKLFEYGNMIMNNISFTDAAKTMITKLAMETNQVINLVIKDETDILYIHKYSPANPDQLTRFSKIGKRSPMYCTASGKAILSTMNDEEIKRIWLNSEIIKYTSRTIIDFDVFMRDINRIRKNGYSTEYEEYEIGLYCIGTVFYDRFGEVAGAISLSIPLSDHNKTKDYYINKLKECTTDISDILVKKV